MVNWYRREMIFSGIMALTLIAVLGAVSYLLSPQTEDHETQYVFQTPETFAFALTEANVSNESPTPENQTMKYDTMDWLQLEFEFTFTGKYPIHEPSTHGKTMRIEPEYHGEFDATPLQSIDIELFRVFCGGSLPENATSLEFFKNITISASLRTTQIIDLGVRTSINERIKTMYSIVRGLKGSIVEISGWDWSCSGFWEKNHAGGWIISVDQLSSMLQGNGTAFITFDATINARVRYEMKNETEETSELTLPTWEGRLGTIEIVYEQGKITWIRYSFYTASITVFSAS
jgi:hypothetical protein